MAKIKGDDITVLTYHDGVWTARAFATTCDLDINVEIIRAGSPTNGRYYNKKARRIDWKVNCGHLLSDAGDDFFSDVESGDYIQLMFTTTLPRELAEDLPNYTPDTKFQVYGSALISRYTITGKHRDYVTSSVSFEGSGPLHRNK
jgi:hypothetical protein